MLNKFVSSLCRQSRLCSRLINMTPRSRAKHLSVSELETSAPSEGIMLSIV